jgi:hypothetical protein
VCPPHQPRETSPTLPATTSTTLPPVRTYYGIQHGLLIGVCDSLEELQQRIAGSPHSVYQSFSTWEEAKAYVIEGMWDDMPEEAKCYAPPPSPRASQSALTTDAHINTPPNSDNEQASVLVDMDNPNNSKVDTSFLVKPNSPAVDMSCLNHTKIQKQLAVQLAKINEK